jgi:hypothetical protein
MGSCYSRSPGEDPGFLRSRLHSNYSEGVTANIESPSQSINVFGKTS